MYAHLYEILLRRAAAHPAAVALGSQEGDGWKTLDSLELLGTVDRLAADLSARGASLRRSWRRWCSPPAPRECRRGA